METSYASDILDFSTRFQSGKACFEYLREIRWPDGFICPACGNHGGCSKPLGFKALKQP
ncbi:MAG: hypothetical protein C4B58_07420 [Deltaproteobacteria bacterium]|nr:MAG: hypothetical protein C4B58_07420 [Deltaproteobacteria bacterium]